MIIVEYEKWRKGRNRTHEAQVNEAESMSVENGALILKDSAGITVRIFASDQWNNAALLQEVVIKNQMGETMVKEPLAKVVAQMVDAA